MNELLDKKEVAEQLKVSEQTIYRWQKQGLPHIKLSEHCIRYDTKKIKKRLKQKTKGEK